MRRLLIFIPILLFTVIAQEKPIDNKADELQIKGYVIGQYTYYEADSAFANGITSPLHDAFAIRSARLVATGQLKHGFNYHIMAEFFPSGSADVQVMQAWVGYQFNQFARFRFGQFKYPFSYEAYKNNTTWSFANSSKVTGAVVKPLGAEGGKFRDIGLEVAGEYEFSGSLTGVYKLMVMNGSAPARRNRTMTKTLSRLLADACHSIFLPVFQFTAGNPAVRRTRTKQPWECYSNTKPNAGTARQSILPQNTKRLMSSPSHAVIMVSSPIAFCSH